jgi:RNA polymerase sigma factor (sigma-70 family)
MVTGYDTGEAAASAAMAGADGPEDDALMLSYCNGDAASFEVLYQRYRRAIYRFFLRQLPQPEAEECHQEVWLKLINSRASYQARGEFRAYLYTIAHRTLTDRHRRMMKHAAIDPESAIDGIADTSRDPESATADDRSAARLYRCIAELPVAQREALLMKESGGLSLAQIATITGATQEGVKSRLRYAMQKLREALTES